MALINTDHSYTRMVTVVPLNLLSYELLVPVPNPAVSGNVKRYN